MRPGGEGERVANCTWNRPWVPGPFALWLLSPTRGPRTLSLRDIETLGKLRTHGERGRAKQGSGDLRPSCGPALVPCWDPSTVWRQSFLTVLSNGLQIC